MDAEFKEAVDGVTRAFEEFKTTNDENNRKRDVVLEEKLTRINASLDKFEDFKTKLAAEEQARTAADVEMKALIEKVEVALNRPRRPSGEEAKIELKALVNQWARGAIKAYTMGEANLLDAERKALADAREEYKALAITDDTGGGYLAPIEYVRDIIKSVTLFSPVRQLATVRPTANKAIDYPKRTGQFAARRTTEQGARTETTGLKYGMVEIPAPEMYAEIDISQQNLEDSAFDLEAELNSESSLQFAVKEGAEFVSGTGIGECEGILTNGDVVIVSSGSSATIKDANGQADGMLDLKHAIKTAYARNAVWALNRTVLGSVRKIKDSQNRYIWMPGIAQGAPNTIDGDPYVEVPDMPNEGSNAFPIAYGDFKRGYVLVDRIAMQLLRDPYTQATSGNIRFLFRRRVGGKVVLGEAIAKLKCST